MGKRRRRMVNPSVWTHGIEENVSGNSSHKSDSSTVSSRIISIIIIITRFK